MESDLAWYFSSC